MTALVLSMLGGLAIVMVVAWCLIRIKKSPNSSSIIIPVNNSDNNNNNNNNNNTCMTTHTTPRLFQPRYTVVHAIFLDSSQSRSPAADRRTQNRGGPRVADQVRTRQSLAGRSNESMSNLDDDLPPPMYNPLSTDATVHPSSDGHDLPTDSCILDIPPPTYSPSRIATTPASHGITETRSGALLSPLPVLDPSLSPSGPLSPLPPTYPQAIAPPQPAQLTENPSVMIAIGSA